MRLIAVCPGPPCGGPDFGVMLGWLREAGHAVQTVSPDAALDIDRDPPDIVVACGPTQPGLAALAQARARDIATVLIVWRHPDQAAFAHADRVLVFSEHLRRTFRAAYGVVAETLPTPLSANPAPEWQPTDTRAFLTFVGAAPSQGAAVFARIATTLAAVRPDIPMLLAQSAHTPPEHLAALTASLGPDVQAQIVTCPPVPEADLFAMTRLLLLPAVDDPFAAHLAALAGWHGVPVVASDNAPLPEIVGAGGLVLALPHVARMDPRLVPGEAETSHWVAAIIRLWDDEPAYEAAATAARGTAADRYDPAILAGRYCQFFQDSI